MARKIPPSSQPPRSGLGTDYAPIMIAAGTALLALIYLILF
jgi:hypothetical protein